MPDSAIELSVGRWRKRLLPVGNVDYKLPDGTKRILRFTRRYLEGLADAFRQRA